MTRAGATAATYRYDPRGQLAVRTAAAPTVAEQTTHYIHDRWGNVIAEAGADGVMRREYVWLPEAEIAPTAASRATIPMPIAVIDGAGAAAPVLYHVHADHLHRPLRMTAATGAAVLWQAEWLPWGEPAPGTLTSAPALGLRFPGQWFQLETGLHYNWHRHYDPTLGRFTQPDPLGFVDGPSVYAYAFSSPLIYVDPSGLNVKKKIGTFIIEMCLAMIELYTGVDVSTARPKRPPLPPIERRIKPGKKEPPQPPGSSHAD